MTVISTTILNAYIASGSNIYWIYSFQILNTTDIVLSVTTSEGQTEVIESNYTVDTYNSRVIYPTPESELSPVPAGSLVTLRRVVPITQELDLVNQGILSKEDMETALDKLTMIAQQIDQSYPNTMVPVGDQGADGSWRINISGNNLSFQRREGGVWIEKGAMIP